MNTELQFDLFSNGETATPVNIIDRYNQYTKSHCWQYDIRIKNKKDDLANSQITQEEADKLSVKDFSYKLVDDAVERKQLTEFIKRHEWLGTLSQYTTHWFACYYKDNLAGVILMNLPNAFSKMLGENTKELERLISRGACVSWSPKNLASSFLTWCIRYMVKNTQYRLFTAYSDPTAKELGTIYQAANFYYLGQKSGTSTRYINPYTGLIVSDRYFRQKTAYKKYANELGILWDKAWSHKTGMSWANIPDDIEAKLRAFSKEKQASSEVFYFPNKHKYALVLGANKKETKRLKKLFLEKNKIHKYPKER